MGNHMRTLLTITLAVLALAGCDREKVRDAKTAAEEAAKAAAAKLSQEYEESKVVAHAQGFISAVEARDLEGLKRLCADVGGGDYEAILTCYYDAFVIEDEQGVDAARKYLAEEMAREDRTDAEAQAVGVLNGYFTAKGSLRTREVAGLILIVALEAKYPHAGGKIGLLLGEHLGLMPPPAPTTQPAASQNSSP